MWSGQCLAIKFYVIFLILFIAFFSLSIDKFKNATKLSVIFVISTALLISFLVLFLTKKMFCTQNWAYFLVIISALILTTFGFVVIF